MNASYGYSSGQSTLFKKFRMNRGFVFGALILIALLAFEVFNYSTTDFALNDLLGDLKFLGIRWATILAIAFCGIDFAGIARLFTPEKGADEPAEVWYLFGAWLLAAAMNATLTWWGVSLAILNHNALGNAMIERETMIKVVPIFVALMVWVIRVLIIGTFSVAGEKLLWASETARRQPRQTQNAYQPSAQPRQITTANNIRPPVQSPAVSAFRPAPKAQNSPEYGNGYSRQEPTYHPMAASGQSNSNHNQARS